ncbi:hypothetical protein A9G29_07810 [Gilliamella sp. Fer2-1]|nr:hypothetical protein A9G45_01510 [Gilliamella apicola]OCG41089.1 hypothetical protein A9G29_07810 [Gilliamella apicola]
MRDFPVSVVATAFNSAGAIIVVIGLSVLAVFFVYQSVEVVVLVAAFDVDIRKNRILITPNLLVLQGGCNNYIF